MKSKGVEDVSQLSGGIHAYQETYPGTYICVHMFLCMYLYIYIYLCECKHRNIGKNSLFHSENFVFDPRISVPSEGCAGDEIVGKKIYTNGDYY
jgi:predicted sulfurtransferase